VKSTTDPAASASYWAPALTYLRGQLTPSYRVEAVDTAGHWPALYLARAGIPLARGWYRQDDFPINAVLYGKLGPTAYVEWLRRLGVRFVVLTDAPPDYSARAEAELLSGPRSPLEVVFATRHVTIFEVPRPTPIVAGVGPARIVSLTQSRIALEIGSAGTYALSVRHSPYWTPSFGCVSKTSDDMMQLRVLHPGRVVLTFHVGATQALRTLAGEPDEVCADSR